MRVLVLGGTTEGRLLASALASRAGFSVISSLAGRVRDPVSLPGDVRIGGFGGVAGLASYLTEARIDTVVDATHPFAATISAHAALACRHVDVPLLVLRRPAWSPVPGDDWIRVPSLAAAASAVAPFDRVFLTTGRQSLECFASCSSWFLVRTVEPPSGPAPPRMQLILDRGPFTLDGEVSLLRSHAIDVVVTKNSGGSAPKLAAARSLGRPVIVVDRPSDDSFASSASSASSALSASSAFSVSTVADALAWLVAR